MTNPENARDLELIYALSRHPQQISTFVNGEAAVVAGRVARLRIVAEKRSAERDLRPGGIPDSVDVAWTPKRSDPAFWIRSLENVILGPGTLMGELRQIAGAASGATAQRRWAYSVAAATAYARGLPPWQGRRHVHAHFAATGGILAHGIARILGIPYSVTVHGSADLFRQNPHLDMLLRDAALVVPVSGYHRDVILERVPGLDPDRIAVIHIGVPSETLAAGGGPIGVRPAADPARIVSVANLVPMKGMPVLIEAVARLTSAGRRVKLDVIGDGPQRAELEARISRLGLTEAVTLRGAMTPAEAHAAIRDSDLFALACIRAPDGSQDGVPTVLMEAMASGRPVVSTRLSGIPELIEDGRTGWLAAPGDVDGLAGSIIDALDHPEEAARRARAGREHVRHHFDQEGNALALLDRIIAVQPPQKASR